jgi:hypothetical protein
VLLKMAEGWREEHRFPALDILRYRTSRPGSLQSDQQIKTGREPFSTLFGTVMATVIILVFFCPRVNYIFTLSLIALKQFFSLLLSVLRIRI